MNNYARDENYGKDSLEYKLLKYRYKLILQNYDELDYEEMYEDKLLGCHTTKRDVADRILNINSKLKEAHKLKEEYIHFNNEDEESFEGADKKRRELNKIIKKYYKSNIKEFNECADTLTNWKTEIINSFLWINGKRISNGPVEGKNTYVKKIISNANGFVNFQRARNKFMYSQNLYEKYSYYEHKDSIQMTKKNKNDK